MGIVMLSISRFGLENVRCFAKKQRIRVRPLTFLVGNNSTGKTTALGCLSSMSDFLSGNQIDFNQPPYQMGGFAHMLHNNSSKKSFSLEISRLIDDAEEMVVAACFADTGGPLSLSRIRYSFSSGSITCKFASARALKNRLWKLSEGAKNEFTITCGNTAPLHPNLLIINVIETIRQQGKNSGSATERNLAAFAKNLSRSYMRKQNGKSTRTSFNFHHYFLGHHPANDLGPVRGKPEWIYVPTRMQSPEAGNFPVRMMRLQREDKELFKEISEEIGRFGKASGLFDGIEVRGMASRTQADPFQLLVKAGKNKANIAHVGYGVSQILPMLFDILTAKSFSSPSMPRIVLLQQPEVHLHPQAQAEFASFLARIAGKYPGRFRFVVETHSDFILDRTSIEIRNRTIAARDVSLAFFDIKNNAAKIANIGYDDAGNLTNAPAGYRTFFNKETNRFLGLD